MAVPFFRASGAEASGSSFPVVVGLPAGLVANDIVILVATTVYYGTISITNTGGWTWNLISGLPVDGNGTEKLYVWWARYSGTETAPTLDPTYNHMSAGTAAWSGCTLSDSVINVSETGSDLASSVSFSFATSIATTIDDCLNIVVCSSGYDSTFGQFNAAFTNSNLTFIATRLNYQTSYGSGGGFGLAEGALATAGAVGTWQTTLSNASAQAYIAFALRPIVSYTLQAQTGVYGSTGRTAVSGWGMNANLGAFAMDGLAATRVLGRFSPTIPYALTGSGALKSIVRSHAAGTYALTGTDAILSRYVVRMLAGETGAFSIDGTAGRATWERSSGGGSMLLGASASSGRFGFTGGNGSYGYAGAAARASREVLHSHGTYGIAGQDATLILAKYDETMPRMARGKGASLDVARIDESRSGRSAS